MNKVAEQIANDKVHIDIKQVTSASDEEALPFGLKIALLASASTVLLVIVLFVMLVRASKDIQDTTKIKTIASSFMKISDPLPSGYSYASGLDFLGTKMVFISQPRTGAIWTIVHVNAAEGSFGPETVIKEIESSARTSRSLTSSLTRESGKFIVREKGSQNVGGRPLTYESGQIASAGSISNALIGCFMPTKEGTTCIFGSSPMGRFDALADDDLLHGISSI